MLCKFCGTKNSEDSLFCNKCGKSLEDKTTEVKVLEKTSQKRPKSKLPLILGITIPFSIIIIVAVLIFTGIIPLLNLNEPVADAGEDIKTKVGETIILNASGSYDSDGNNLIYLWEVNGRNYEGETVKISFGKQGVYTAKLIVEDSRFSSTDTVIITVDRKDNTENVAQENIKSKQDEPFSVSWSEAKYHIGETITVYGPVVSANYDETTVGGTIFLNIGKDYPDPEGFSVWIDSQNISKFTQAPEVYYYGKNISVTGLIVDIDDLPHMEVTDPSQISVDEAIAEQVAETVEEEPEEEPATVDTSKEETTEGVLVTPTIRLEIIEGPVFSQLGDNTCYYRVKAHITGNPSPTISFNKDDSSGSLGKNIAQVNLNNKGESFTLEATATNSEGSASASVALTHTCQDHIPIIIQNNTGGNVSINLSGPGNYSFNVAPGQKIIYVIPGTYNYKGIGCGGSTLSGTEDLSSSNYEWKWWCE